MRVKELIQRLMSIEENHGDIEVVVCRESNSGSIDYKIDRADITVFGQFTADSQLSSSKTIGIKI